MDKSPDASRTISEVAEWLGVQAHVLRFWESKFTHVKPVKRAGGRRYYRPADMLLLGGIKKLLHDDGMTIKGVQKTLREQGVAHVSGLSQDLGDVAASTEKNVPAKTKIVPLKEVQPQKPEVSSPVQVEHEPEAQAADATLEEKPQSEPESVQEPEPLSEVAEATPAPPPSVEEQPILPSFLHRPASKPINTPAPTQEPVEEAQPSLVVDAPDPPADSELPYANGPLAHVAKLDRLSAAQIAEIAPLAKELQSWLDRAGSAGVA